MTKDDYVWIITVGASTIGPHNAPDHFFAQLKDGFGTPFQMHDDDNLVYQGRIIGDYERFEPLDQFGGPNAGCTLISYRGESGNWEML
tara:strand:- start:3220 stop:3483 length:264 start_codon:yes stop_codon:yes gene_type:complete